MSYRPSTLLASFLGIERIKKLQVALVQIAPAENSISSVRLILSLIVAAIPFVIPFIAVLPARPIIELSTGTLAYAALLALILRRGFAFPIMRTTNLKQELSLVHVAFALSCIPALIVVFSSPELLSEKYNVVSGKSSSGLTSTLFGTLFILLTFSGFAAICEELIYRGLLLSSLRRSSYFTNAIFKDVFAVGLSSLIFAIAHLLIWGPAAAFALFFIGIGLGVGYLVCKENVVPVLIYHWIFNFLSLLCLFLL